MRAKKTPHEIDDLFKGLGDQQYETASEPQVSLPESQLSAAAPDAPDGSAGGDAAQLGDSGEPPLPESGGNDEAVSTDSKPKSKFTRDRTAQKAERRRSPAFDASPETKPGAISGHAIAERYMSVRQVASRYDVGISTIWRWALEDNRFPAPLRLSKGITRWLESELLSFEALRRTPK